MNDESCEKEIYAFSGTFGVRAIRDGVLTVNEEQMNENSTGVKPIGNETEMTLKMGFAAMCSPCIAVKRNEVIVMR